MNAWYGVDFDCTLALYDGDVSKAGEPIKPMVDRVKKWLADGYEVRIVTARLSPEWDDQEEQTKIIQDWCEEHIGVRLPVQCHKNGGMIELWDDRAVGVIPNTGARVQDIAVESAKYFNAQLNAIRRFDENFGIEGDVYAVVRDGIVRVESGCPELDAWQVSPRGARCLAASLLRAADEAEATNG